MADWLGAQDGVSNVHDLHIWALSTTRTALAVHLVWDGTDADGFLDQVTDALEHDFAIAHSTVQLERTPRERAGGLPCRLRRGTSRSLAGSVPASLPPPDRARAAVMRSVSRHPEAHFVSRIGWLRAAVLGANDGIVATASLIVGVATASAATSDVLVAGVAGLVAGAMSMAAGEYVSVSSQFDTENADQERERAELSGRPGAELEELTKIYVGRGVELDLARQREWPFPPFSSGRTARSAYEVSLDPWVFYRILTLYD